MPSPGDSSWIRCYRRGSLVAPAVAPPVPAYSGWFEASADSVATCWDVLIDWGDTGIVAATPGFYVAAYAITMPGTPKAYRGSYFINPQAGVFAVNSPTGGMLPTAWSSCIQPGGLGGLIFILQCAGIAACAWGIDVAIQGAPGETVPNIILTGIAHGREVA